MLMPGGGTPLSHNRHKGPITRVGNSGKLSIERYLCGDTESIVLEVGRGLWAPR